MSPPTSAVAQVFDNGVIRPASDLKTGDKVFLPPTDRNKDVILDALRPLLNKSNIVLEVGSGSGQHVYHFSNAYPEVTFQPTEYDLSLFSSIKAYTADLPANNRVKAPLELDATNTTHWDTISKAAAAVNHSAGYDLVITTNVFHITPWTVATGVVRGAGQVLKPGGHFVFYGAFKKNGKFNSEGNVQFDLTLRGRNPLWGVRDIDEIQKIAENETQLKLVEVKDMPSNNYLVIFQKIALEE
ncbi:hypothetical protein BGZ95_008508 [Linnemannia exigua]|uniref:DUF938-domain-containing protein n=1 Tax=Linnemannia exigua TaxID=604196 RepID=A0AAD4H7B1_9FUNG|nr:hypothetical protein BGZ95_008508 [Linnemannia exigua]